MMVSTLQGVVATPLLGCAANEGTISSKDLCLGNSPRDFFARELELPLENNLHSTADPYFFFFFWRERKEGVELWLGSCVLRSTGEGISIR